MPSIENIAALMLEGTQLTPTDDPAEASWARRSGQRFERARGRAMEIAPRIPGYEHAIGVVKHDQRFGGGLLAGALAFRLFGAVLPLALLVAVVLGYATTVDRTAPQQAGEAVGLGSAVLDSVGESARLSSGTRWSVLIFSVFAVLWSANSAARAIRAVHSLAWEGGVARFRRPLPAALVLLAALAAFAVVIAVAGRARAELGLAGVLVSVLAVAAFFGIWLVVARLLPHGDAGWRSLAPGALVVALGIQVIHLGTVLFIAGRIEHAANTYGTLGVAATVLVWLFVVSRVIVGSAMLNAALAHRGPPAPEEVQHV